MASAHLALMSAVSNGEEIAPEIGRDERNHLLVSGYVSWMPDGRLVPTEAGREYVRRHVEFLNGEKS